MRRTAALLALCVALVAAARADAAGWTPAVAVQPASAATAGTANSRIVVNSAGDQALVWDDMQTNTADAPTCAHDEVATRVPGGAWSTPVVVGCNAAVAMGASGVALAFWADDTAGTANAVTAPAGSSFGPAVTVDASMPHHYSLTGGVDSQGVATLVWADSNNADTLYTSTQNSDGSWPAAPQPVGSDLYSPTIGFGPKGDALIAAVSYQSVSPYNRALDAVYRSASSSPWGSAYALVGPTTTAVTLNQPQVAFDAQDRATVVEADGVNDFGVSAWTRDPSGTWSAEQVVFSGAQEAFDPGFALDSAGNAQIAYPYMTYDANTNVSAFEIRPAERLAGQTTWSTHASLVPGGCANPPTTPSVAFDPQGNALIGFACDGNSYSFERMAGAATFSAFSGPPGATQVSYSTDPNGYTIATWTSAGATYTSVYDAVPPTIDSLTAPPSAVAGQPVSFDVSGSDLWGPTTYTIDFGDGQPAVSGRAIASASPRGALARATAGGTVTHTYATAGSYTATVTVNDSAGNSTSATRTVNVAAAPVAPSPVTPPANNLPPPVLGKSINVFVEKAPISVKLPGQKQFHLLTTTQAHLPNGTVIDARKGVVLVVIDNGNGGQDSAQFYDGVFEVNQPKRLKGLANIFLNGGGFKGCPKAPKDPHAQLSRKKLSPTRSVRHLWGQGTGKFRTVGRFASATVRGTNWLTDDHCNGTLVRVAAGKVAVRDFVKQKTVLVRAHHKYFARAR